MSTAINGNILTPGGWIRGALRFGKRIDAIDGSAANPAINSDDYIIPGFVDLHVHGAGGHHH